MATPAIASLQTPAPSELRRRYVNYLASGLITLAALCGVTALLFILGYVILRGWPAMNVAFFTERPLPFGEEGGGVAPAIIGTLLMLLVAAVIAIPIGIGTAIYLSEIGRGSFAQFVRFIIDMLAGLPSIVVGVFVWAVLVRTVFNHFSGFAGGVALAIIMVPIVTRTVEEILRLVPGNLREASLALGVPQWRTILGVVLPTARVGVVTGVVLSLARAGGETAPLIMTALGNQFFNLNIMEPMAALPVQIYTFAKSPYDDWHTKAWGSALVLVMVIGCLSLVARLAVRRKA
jgi:phosphate transport system permease protein